MSKDWTLNRIAEGNVGYAQEQLRRAERAKQLVEQLPKEMQELSAYEVKGIDDEGLWLGFRYEEEEDTIRVLKTCGVVGLTSRKYWQNKDSWFMGGVMRLGNVPIDVSVSGTPAPSGCSVKAKQMKKTVYVAICKETGKQIEEWAGV